MLGHSILFALLPLLAPATAIAIASSPPPAATANTAGDAIPATSQASPRNITLMATRIVDPIILAPISAANGSFHIPSRSDTQTCSSDPRAAQGNPACDPSNQTPVYCRDGSCFLSAMKGQVFVKDTGALAFSTDGSPRPANALTTPILVAPGPSGAASRSLTTGIGLGQWLACPSVGGSKNDGPWEVFVDQSSGIKAPQGTGFDGCLRVDVRTMPH